MDENQSQSNQIQQPEEQPAYFCSHCGGAIFSGEMISWAVGPSNELFVSHRFKTRCANSLENDATFLKDCGVEPIIKPS